MIRRPPRSTPIKSSAASDVYKRQSQSSAMPTIKVNVESGFTGGAPPDRHYRALQKGVVEISEDSKFSELFQKSQGVVGHIVSNHQYDPNKTIKENGIKDGQTISFHNGAKD
eukprot:TRINITY_DN68_c0_g1_i4.p1 TRINITY_DN68_c0_g1~~TRINITY_DN68_c0_g1_i4.p1  ORF type:complete len:112 (+),score=26.90 TRINITY_DN68_c0_g1_i4:2-337(+)